ncbi:MAG TPA: type II secretion system F family protein, partial [Burkholderiaceae bacterium]|nr:type II secretion system F family protein [Burkholderiaceae bacterium]
VSTAFFDAGLTDTVTRRLLAVGERTGNFERVLQTIAERHASRFTTFIERATRVVEPLLLLVVALVVGGIVVMMYMPVFDVATSLH